MKIMVESNTINMINNLGKKKQPNKKLSILSHLQEIQKYLNLDL